MKNLSNKVLIALVAEPNDEVWYQHYDELLRRLEQANALKCCGNCKKYVENRNCYNMRPGSYCPGWLPDGLTRKDRE